MSSVWLLSLVGVGIVAAVLGLGLALVATRSVVVLRRYAAALPGYVSQARVPLARRIVSLVRERQSEFDAWLWIANWTVDDAVVRLQQLWLVLVGLIVVGVLTSAVVVKHLSAIVLALATAVAVSLAWWCARVLLVWQVHTEARLARQQIDDSLANLALLVRIYVQGGASATEALLAISEFADAMSEAGARDVESWIQGSQRNDYNIGAVLSRFGATYGVPRVAQLGSYLEQSILSGRPVSETLDVAIRDAYQALFDATVVAVHRRVRVASLVFLPGIVAIGVVFLTAMIASLHGLASVTRLFGGGL